MKRIDWRVKLSLLLVVGLIGCLPARRAKMEKEGKGRFAPKTEEKSAPVEAAKPANPNEIADLGLVLTKDGIEFAGEQCTGAYDSQVSSVVTNTEGRRTAYVITSTCTSTGESVVWAYSNIKYNSLGQMNGYDLYIKSSRLGKEYNLNCSKLYRDNLWEVISYKIMIDGKEYKFKRK